MKICKICGKEFEECAKNQKTCSEDCFRKNKKEITDRGRKKHSEYWKKWRDEHEVQFQEYYRNWLCSHESYFRDYRRVKRRDRQKEIREKGKVPLPRKKLGDLTSAVRRKRKNESWEEYHDYLRRKAP